MMFLNSAISGITTIGMASHLTNSGGNVLLTSSSAQLITHVGQSQACKNGIGDDVGDPTSRITCTGLTGYTWTDASPDTCEDADGNAAGDPSSQTNCEGTDNLLGQTFFPLYSATISSTNGGVSIESNLWEGGDMTSAAAISIATDADSG